MCHTRKQMHRSKDTLYVFSFLLCYFLLCIWYIIKKNNNLRELSKQDIEMANEMGWKKRMEI